jgi:hypothetical protein
MPTTFRGEAGGGGIPVVVVVDAMREDHLDSSESRRAGHSLSCTGVGFALAVVLSSSIFDERPVTPASSSSSFDVVLDFLCLRLLRFDIRSSVPRAMYRPMSAIDNDALAVVVLASTSTDSGDFLPSMFSTKSTDQTGG